MRYLCDGDRLVVYLKGKPPVLIIDVYKRCEKDSVIESPRKELKISEIFLHLPPGAEQAEMVVVETRDAKEAISVRIYLKEGELKKEDVVRYYKWARKVVEGVEPPGRCEEWNAPLP